MTALVDAVARARQEGQGAAVAATLAHGTFGRVDLEFRQKDDGLTVTMASADPGFAPAVLAASRADTGNAGNQGTPARTPVTRARVTKAGSQNFSGQAFAGQSQSQSPSQGGDGRQPPRPTLAEGSGPASRAGGGPGDDPKAARAASSRDRAPRKAQ
jgi:Meckel syndrome type 1 protein